MIDENTVIVPLPLRPHSLLNTRSEVYRAGQSPNESTILGVATSLGSSCNRLGANLERLIYTPEGLLDQMGL